MIDQSGLVAAIETGVDVFTTLYAAVTTLGIATMVAVRTGYCTARFHLWCSVASAVISSIAVLLLVTGITVTLAGWAPAGADLSLLAVLSILGGATIVYIDIAEIRLMRHHLATTPDIDYEDQ